ncbi:sensor histidine kinase [Paenibacillus sp. J5C_2022]|uniref:cache domain-containing sensor histidine kinase n=1 Tax=Paenibacillus sp. J5C2022 TaxID=2977129 RepID=UPI0021D2E2C5|nr:sensor histidine kinase [Paenibacillus sp. J5C2022]MCU6712671.1 sensor histidine kinase [Paenibacillus sp. J5C2022]
MTVFFRKLRQMYQERVQLRLTIYFLFILIPLVGVSLFANFRSTDILEGQTDERTLNSLQSALSNIDLVLQDLDNLSALISSDHSIEPVLHEADDILLPSELYGFYNIIDRLTNITAINGYLQEISILHTPSGFLLSTQHGGRKLDYRKESWFDEVEQASGKTVLYAPMRQETASPLFGNGTVSFMRIMDVHKLYSASNVLILTISRDKLLGMIEELKVTPETSIYLYSPDGRLLAGTDELYVEDEWRHLEGRKAAGMEAGMLVWRMQSAQSGWSLVMVQPEGELYKESRKLSQFTNVIILLSIVLAFLISLVVYKGIAAPLSSLLHGMKQMRLRKFGTRLPNARKDEFGALTEAFNGMIADQQRLIQDIYEHQLQLSKTELKFLHSQINPHFLYNTLDSIYWTAKNYEADEISEMVLNLSKFFRLNLSKGRETFTVSETLEHLMYYLRVQQFRFMDQFTVRFDIKEETRDIHVLKLLLQPIVENAILHGLEKRGTGGELVISSTLEDGMLCLTVQDNGAGIQEERLAYMKGELMRMESKEQLVAITEQQHKELFGLRNVLGRLKLYYGDSAMLHIESVAGEGTMVAMRFPLERETVASA